MIKEFYLIRHGESTYNRKGLIQGQSNDSVLTDNGRNQVQTAAEILKNRGIEVVIASPLDRAFETGKIIADIFRVPIIKDKRFIEVNVGIIEGLTYEEVIRRYGELYEKWRSYKPEHKNICFKNGETKHQVQKRTFGALDDYARTSHYQKLLIACHGITMIQVLLHFRINQTDIPNASIIHLRFKDNKWSYHGFLST